MLFATIFKKDDFSGKEVPKEHDYSGNDFGEHVVDAHFVCADIHDQRIQTQSDDPDDGEHKEFRPAVAHRAVVEYPRDAQQVVGDESQDERDGGGKEIVNPAYIGQQEQSPVVHNKSGTAHKAITEQLYQEAVGLIFE